MANYPRETVEFVPVVVTVDGAPVTSGVQICLNDSPATRPTIWVAATVLDGKTGFMVQGRSEGNLYVWAKYTDSPEVPVIYCGRVTIT